MPRVAVLISGTGTLLQSLIDDPHRGYEIAVVGADRPAAGLQRATDAGIPTLVVRPADYPDRTAWSAALADLLADFTVDWVVSAGFMRILDATFLDKFPQRVVNSHPALLPAFPGAHAVADQLVGHFFETRITVDTQARFAVGGFDRQVAAGGQARELLELAGDTGVEWRRWRELGGQGLAEFVEPRRVERFGL